MDENNDLIQESSSCDIILVLMISQSKLIFPTEIPATLVVCWVVVEDVAIVDDEVDVTEVDEKLPTVEHDNDRITLYVGYSEDYILLLPSI